MRRASSQNCPISNQQWRERERDRKGDRDGDGEGDREEEEEEEGQRGLQEIVRSEKTRS